MDEEEEERDVRTYSGMPSGFSDAQDVVEKEAGAVFHVDVLALEEGAHGRVCPECMNVGCECFQERCRVGGMATCCANGGVVRAGDALQDGLPSAASTDAEFAVSKEEAVCGVIAGTRSPFCPSGSGVERRRSAAEFGEELSREIRFYAEEGKKTETESRLGLCQGRIGREIEGRIAKRRRRWRGRAIEFFFDDGEQLLDGAERHAKERSARKESGIPDEIQLNDDLPYRDLSEEVVGTECQLKV